VYLRSIARKHVQGEVSAADIEKDVQRQFGIDLTGKLTELQEPMEKSRVCTHSLDSLPSTLPRQKHMLAATLLCIAMLTSLGEDPKAVYLIVV
jgi:hypothetical protein